MTRILTIMSSTTISLQNRASAKDFSDSNIAGPGVRLHVIYGKRCLVFYPGGPRLRDNGFVYFDIVSRVSQAAAIY